MKHASTGPCQWRPGREARPSPLYLHNYTVPKLGLPFVVSRSDGCQPFLSQLPSRGGNFPSHHLNLDGFVINNMTWSWGWGTSGLRPRNFYFCTEGNSTTYKEVQSIHKKKEVPCGRPNRYTSGSGWQPEKRQAQPSQSTASWVSHWGSRHEWFHLGFSSSSPGLSPTPQMILYEQRWALAAEPCPHSLFLKTTLL